MVVLSQACALLVRVKQLGMKIALATSSDKEHLGHCGKLVDMDDRVDEASSSADAKASKPEPDIFAAAPKKVNMRADQGGCAG